MEIGQQRPVSIEDVTNVYDSSPVHCAVITNSANKIIYASPSFADALGYKVQELYGIEFSITPAVDNASFLVNGAGTQTEKPSDKGYVVQKNGSKALVDYESFSLESSNNEPYTFSRISNLKGYLQYNLLAEYKETVENILNNLTASVIVIDPELVIIENNSTFVKTFELEPAISDRTALKDLPCSFWQDENILHQFKQNYEQQQYDFDIEMDWEREATDAKSFKIVSRLIHNGKANSDLKILLVITNITEEKANQTGRNQQIRHIMHELRNPLSNLSLCVELLADSVKENNQEDSAVFLAKASNSIQRMKQLINDLGEVKSS